MKNQLPEPFAGKNYVKNSTKCHGNEWPCAICGTPVKDLAGAHWVYVDAMAGAFISAAENERSLAAGIETMGAFPIGPACWKKWPALHGVNTR